MQISSITSTIAQVQGTSDTILALVEGLDPGAAAPAETVGQIIDLTAGLASLALIAWSNASGIPITPDSVLALTADQTPLPLPDDQTQG